MVVQEGRALRANNPSWTLVGHSRGEDPSGMESVSKYIVAAHFPPSTSSFPFLPAYCCLRFFYFFSFFLFSSSASFWLVQTIPFYLQVQVLLYVNNYHISLSPSVIFVDQSSHRLKTQKPNKPSHLIFLFFTFSSSTSNIANMYAARSMKPKLSLSIATTSTPRPSLSLKSPGIPRTPISPVAAASPTSKRFSSLHVPSYNYSNSCSSKSILKKQPVSRPGVADKRIQFQVTPTVHCVTPIENPDEYYGTHTKITREERRWTVRE